MVSLRGPAECLEQTSNHDPQQMALGWDMACKNLIESFRQKEDDKTLENIYLKAYKNQTNIILFFLLRRFYI